MKACKKKTEISEKTIEFVRKIHETWNVGYQTLCHFLQLPEWQTRNIYNILNYVKEQKKIKTNIHSKIFYATEVNYLWHTDIHYLKNKFPYENQTLYMIAFIDDCSRKILYYDIGNTKDQLFFVNSLIKCINLNNTKPFILTTDNGGEFTGKFARYIIKMLSIKHWRTHPYTPEQNGKIERFWRRVERLENYKDLEKFIQSYNEIIPQRSLRKFAQTHLKLHLKQQDATPERIFQNAPKFDHYHPGIIVQFDKNLDK